MRKFVTKSVFGIIVMFLVTQLAACGTLMYPERRGQKAGEIDVKVAVLDGIGLLFCIIPGVVAYIVDFSTGAIYLPAGKRNVVMLEDLDLKAIHVNPELLRDPEKVHEIVAREMELPGTVNWNSLESAKVAKDQIRVRLAEAKAVGYAR